MIYAVVGAQVAALGVIAALVYALIRSKEREGDAIAGRVEAGGRAEQYRLQMETADRNAASHKRRADAYKKELDEVNRKWVPANVRTSRDRVFDEWTRDDAAEPSDSADGAGPVPIVTRGEG